MERTHQVHVDIAIVVPGSERHDIKLKRPPSNPRGLGHEQSTFDSIFAPTMPSELALKNDSGVERLGLAVLRRKSGFVDCVEKEVADVADDDQ